jgi:hypothetical protein
MKKLIPLFVACAPLEVEVELQEACVSRAGVVIAGTEAPRATTRFAVQDLGALQDLAEIDGVMLLDRIAIRPANAPGVDITSARATITSADLPVLEIACGGETPCMSGTDIVLPAELVDVVAYVRSGAIDIEVEVEGQLPSRPWIADVEVCLDAELAYDLP